jgi:hypothetical protein
MGASERASIEVRERRRPHRTAALAWCALLTLAAALPGIAFAAPARTWIVGATVISPERHDAGQRLHVLIQGDRITAVTATLPADALPGLNGYLEMQRLVAAGMGLRQLFEAATISNAKAFGLDGDIGTVQPGKRANVVLLGRSPLESVEAYDQVHTVWIGGTALDPASLEATRP